MKPVLWWLFLGTRGGLNRAKIIKQLRMHPYNANQLAEALDVNYRTITHHLKILEKSNLVKSVGEKYGKMYVLTDEMERDYAEFEAIWEQLKNKKQS